jgi:hypothetical protein
LCTRQKIWPTKIYEVEDWRSCRLKKLKVEGVEVIWIRSLKKSKIEELEVWRLNPTLQLV